MHSLRNRVRDHHRIVIKVGSSSLTHPQTGKLDLIKMEILVRELVDLQNRGKDVILVSSGAIMVGSQTMGLAKKPAVLSRKQACASIGQAKLMMLYQKLFSEYNTVCSQILLTKHTMRRPRSLFNARSTFEELLEMNVIPIVNENDTIATDEIEFGDNDTLSALVAAMVEADLLILLSDIDGLFTDDPNKNPQARFIEEVHEIDDALLKMGKGSASAVGTGGMSTKLHAARIACDAGTDMIIANASDFHNIHHVVNGDPVGTFFACCPVDRFEIENYLEE